jgi:hypothetical protein
MRAGLYWRLWKNFRSQPGYYFYLVRRRQAASIRRMLESGREPEPGSYFPTRLNLRLLYRCNLRCSMCGQWGNRGPCFGYGKTKGESVLGQKTIERVLDELAPRGLRLVDMVEALRGVGSFIVAFPPVDGIAQVLGVLRVVWRDEQFSAVDLSPISDRDNPSSSFSADLLR